MSIPSFLNAATVRDNWVFQQLSQPLAKVYREGVVGEVTLGLTNYRDSVVAQQHVYYDLGLLDLKLEAGQRFYTGLSDEGRFLKGQLGSTKRNFGLEVGRTYSSSGYYGRLAVGSVWFQPAGTRWWHLRVGTGVSPTPTVPWGISVAGSIFQGPTTVVSVQMDGFREMSTSDSLKLGLSVAWVYDTLLVMDAGVHEHVLFQVGPTLQWQTGPSLLRVAILERLWMDKTPIKAGSPVNKYPSEFTSPDLSLTWSLCF